VQAVPTSEGHPINSRFAALWQSLTPIGRDPATGGYLRYSWSDADLACREWFVEEALDRSLTIDPDGNGNVWAWWGDPTAGDAVVTGSHLDSVPHGGAYDGPLGVVSALLAIDLLRERGVAPARPVGVVAFTEEEGSRFGLACLGSRLLTGAVPADWAHKLVDVDGISLSRAMTDAGVDTSHLGADPERIARLGSFVELHVEQGRGLRDRPVGVASAIWPHGRWRLNFTGEGNHAGTTPMDARRDPMLTYAYTVLAANKEARLAGAHATIGRVSVEPNATNAIPERVTAWLDARCAEQSTLDSLVAAIRQRAVERAGRDGTTVEMTAESVSPETAFDAGLRDRLARLLDNAPVLPTGAGHDAGVLAAAGVPTAMLFVRNPTGISHSPAEHATDEDCGEGVVALARVLEELACR
jgi:beta-ureidopropionase / N-carbamoyl-L-amino-acid hydrolase